MTKWLVFLLVGQSVWAARIEPFDRFNFIATVETAYRAQVTQISFPLTISQGYKWGWFHNWQSSIASVGFRVRFRDDQEFNVVCRRVNQLFDEKRGHHFVLQDCDTITPEGKTLNTQEAKAYELPTANKPLDLDHLMDSHLYNPL